MRLKINSGFSKNPFGQSDRRQSIERNEGAHVMSAVVLQMLCVAGLLGSAVLAIVLSRSKIATAIIYSATLAASAIALIRVHPLAAWRSRRTSPI